MNKNYNKSCITEIIYVIYDSSAINPFYLRIIDLKEIGNM